MQYSVAAERPLPHRDDSLIPHPDPRAGLCWPADSRWPWPAEQLVGRAAELGAIESALGELERRCFGALELRGRAGHRQDAPARASWPRRADARGRIVLSGSAAELERELPFWVFVDALDEYLAGAGAAPAGRAGRRRTLADLGASSPRCRRPRQPATGDERLRMHRAVARSCSRRSRPRSRWCCVLDDLHWADPASLELLGSLLRRPPDAPVLIARGAAPPPAVRTRSPARSSARAARAMLTRLELARPERATRRASCSAPACPAARPSALYEAELGQPVLSPAARALAAAHGQRSGGTAQASRWPASRSRARWPPR